jgi:hypothetical protein
MSAQAIIAECSKCKRALLFTRTNMQPWLKKDGWVNVCARGGTCPKCRRENPDKNYWRVRDIVEASSSRHETWQVRNIDVGFLGQHDRPSGTVRIG